MNAFAGWLPALTADGWLLFATYSVRLAAYGFISVILGLYLAALGFAAAEIGLVFTAAVGGGGLMTAGLSWVADRWGRRRVLVIGALLMAAAGAVFASSSSLVLLLVAAALGTLSPSGSEVGPFLSIEQAMLPQTTRAEERTKSFGLQGLVFYWFNLRYGIDVKGVWERLPSAPMSWRPCPFWPRPGSLRTLGCCSRRSCHTSSATCWPCLCP